MHSIGIVVIGRNEGARLLQCLDSIRDVARMTVYVDSGSSDNSVAAARARGVEVVELDPSRPFSAARARNEGFGRLTDLCPDISFVQFIDGDCVLLPGWLQAAAAALAAEPSRGAVVGHLLERNADASIYNRLCALEWRSKPGDLVDYGAFGGISMMRAAVFRQLGGFKAEVIAGEDSELGVRMGLAGYRITKLDQNMATHDANMTSFKQWWRRSVRAGHAIGQRADINGDSPQQDCIKQRKSTWLWGIALPVLVLLLLIPTRGWSLLLLAAYGFLGYRVVNFRRGEGDDLPDAMLYARFILLAKFANGLGLIKYQFNKMAQRFEIIEYK